jgi:hypothetical protein
VLLAKIQPTDTSLAVDSTVARPCICRFTDAPPGTRSAEFKAALRAKFVEQVSLVRSATVWQCRRSVRACYHKPCTGAALVVVLSALSEQRKLAYSLR